MNTLLKWLGIFLLASLLGWLGGKILAPEVAQGAPLCVQNTPYVAISEGIGGPPDILIWVDGVDPYETIEIWLILDGAVAHWFDRWPIALSIPPGEYTLVVRHPRGVDVLPLRVGQPKIPNFAFK